MFVHPFYWLEPTHPAPAGKPQLPRQLESDMADVDVVRQRVMRSVKLIDQEKILPRGRGAVMARVKPVISIHKTPFIEWP